MWLLLQGQMPKKRHSSEKHACWILFIDKLPPTERHRGQSRANNTYCLTVSKPWLLPQGGSIKWTDPFTLCGAVADVAVPMWWGVAVCSGVNVTRTPPQACASTAAFICRVAAGLSWSLGGRRHLPASASRQQTAWEKILTITDMNVCSDSLISQILIHQFWWKFTNMLPK